ncbi:hypothetical protein COLO4_12511 [Corchorus olitorius]|uniref:Uncharacterized protein n=1 Tax=Corchorus olitorius TaxID=93759 RepID=A0A1R3K0K9_9ROSI|nr:hypothetical protein COLO4_12511 [Corchorus olitorius]
MDGYPAPTTPKPPQISEMFQKFALAFKTKTFEFFADEENNGGNNLSDSDGFSLLDSTEDFITDQKVVVIKPDPPPNSSSSVKKSFQRRTIDTQMADSLISSVFAAVSSFESSYLLLQTSHVPFVEESVMAADRALVSHLQRLSDLKRFYRELRKNPNFEDGLSLGSCLEAQVQENQSKLRTLETVSNRLQEEIDEKDNEVSSLRKKLAEIQWANTKLSKKLSGFGLSENESLCNGNDATSSLKQLLEHVSSNPMELLSRNQNCEYSRFCEKKYQELIHPTMESSIFSNLDQNEVVLNSWRSLSIFYESFVNMASSIWTLHKLAFSFDPVVEIFQVERGADFSMVYMEDATKRYNLPGQSRVKVGFTVVPGFKIGRTVIQSQVYLSGLKCTG